MRGTGQDLRPEQEQRAPWLRPAAACCLETDSERHALRTALTVCNNCAVWSTPNEHLGRKGVLYGIAAGLPVFHKQGFGNFVNTASTAGHKTVPNQAVYSGTKFAVRAMSEGLRQEASDKLRVTIISPGFVKTPFVETVANAEVKAQLAASRDKIAIP
jgi:NAD(P)-dependent dehydrogenase (short-subunit alcohol dehydrogenase family)